MQHLLSRCNIRGSLHQVYAHSSELAYFSSFSPQNSKTKQTAKKKQTKSSRQWTMRQQKDPYVKMAKSRGSPSRAIFKLEEIESMAATFIKQQNQKRQKKNKKPISPKVFHPSCTVIDLGAAPGSWTQWIGERLDSNGILIALDLLELDGRTVNGIECNEDGPSFHCIQGDFTKNETKQHVLDILLEEDKSHGVDCVISDMAANFTGDSLTDALRTMNLCEDALMLAAGSSCFDPRFIPATSKGDGVLRNGGTFLCKFFACGQTNEEDLREAIGRNFEVSTVLKPKASRKESAELYMFATGYKGGQNQ